jgi:ankyrin repeat protein
MAMLLLQAGADPNKKTLYDETPLSNALKNNLEYEQELLL